MKVLRFVAFGTHQYGELSRAACSFKLQTVEV